jgi:hypothetical protein
MNNSAKLIDQYQDQWVATKSRDPQRPSYTADLSENLFLKGLHPETEQEFRAGDGSELEDKGARPPKMRALASSSALAVNFFDPWRIYDKSALSRILGLDSPVSHLSFEFKTRDYPVRPRSPNLDVMLRLADGQSVAIESKFSEPYRSGDGFGGLSTRYFPPGKDLWIASGLPAAQVVANQFRPTWVHLDVPQLVKHMLGLACDPASPSTLIYLWFDTGEPDAQAHRREIERFAVKVADDSVAFKSNTYQEIFAALNETEEPAPGWHRYMKKRYFSKSQLGFKISQ